MLKIHHVLIFCGPETSHIPRYHLTSSLSPSLSSFLWVSTDSSAEPGEADSGLEHNLLFKLFQSSIFGLPLLWSYVSFQLLIKNTLFIN